MKQQQLSRWQGLHLEPLWWGLFSAGGVCFAVFTPALVLVFAILLPAGVISVEWSLMQQWVGSFWGLLVVGAGVCLPAFHAAHRIRHGLHDVKWGGGTLSVVVCYGAAALLSITALLAWVRIA